MQRCARVAREIYHSATSSCVRGSAWSFSEHVNQSYSEHSSGGNHSLGPVLPTGPLKYSLPLSSNALLAGVKSQCSAVLKDHKAKPR